MPCETLRRGDVPFGSIGTRLEAEARGDTLGDHDGDSRPVEGGESAPLGGAALLAGGGGAGTTRCSRKGEREGRGGVAGAGSCVGTGLCT